MGTLPFFHDYLYQQNFDTIAGLDEAGRGACAGPLVVAACVLPVRLDSTVPVDEIIDSKKLSPTRREKIYEILCQVSLDFSILSLSSRVIDSIGVHQANLLGMRLAIENLNIPPAYVLIDGFAVPGLTIPSMNIVRGDTYVQAIAAASILAKVYRDKIMVKYDQNFPKYGFSKHKGYGTRLHQEALEKFGPCECHRFSYANVKPFIADVQNEMVHTEVQDFWVYSRREFKE